MNKRKFMYFLKQILCGLIFVVSGVALPFFLDGDVTVSVLLVPLGLFILFTRELLMEF